MKRKFMDNRKRELRNNEETRDKDSEQDLAGKWENYLKALEN